MPPSRQRFVRTVVPFVDTDCIHIPGTLLRQEARTQVRVVAYSYIYYAPWHDYIPFKASSITCARNGDFMVRLPLPRTGFVRVDEVLPAS
jgi:hypothetical protein